MKGKGLLVVLVVCSILSTVVAPMAQADEGIVVPYTPGGIAVSQAYIDALTYWYKLYFKSDWEQRLNDALTPPSVGNDKAVQNERVMFTGVPANAQWIDCWKLELNGRWTTLSAFRPAQSSSPVTGDLAVEGRLPGVFVLRVCDRTGQVLAGGPKLIVVSWTGGRGGAALQTFDIPSVPVATPAMLAGISM